MDARLRSPPKPTRVTVPVPTPRTSVEAAKTSETLTEPATEAETREVITALLTLGQERLDNITEDNTPVNTPVETISNKIPIDNSADPPDIQPPIEVNVIVKNPPETAPEKELNVIGTAIKTDLEEERKTTPTSKDSPIKKGTVKFKSYRLKKTKKDLKLRCRVCLVLIPSVREYNKHYIDKHPPCPCPYCARTFISPRTLARHLYAHKEIMYECKICAKGFSFESQYRAHNRKHSGDTGFVCMKVGCGKRFKRDNELKAHVKSHRKTAIKCGEKGCGYSNKDIRNVKAHRKCHTNQLPYYCALCGQRFRWQQQKKRHYNVCPEMK